VSKKTVSFSMPTSATRARKPEPIALEALSASHRSAGSRPDDWVRDRDLAAGPSPVDDALAPPRILLDVAAERSLMEVLSLKFPRAVRARLVLVDQRTGRTRAPLTTANPFSRIARRETGVFRRPMREKVARSAG
jgi:hypothetical protein